MQSQGKDYPVYWNLRNRQQRKGELWRSRWWRSIGFDFVVALLAEVKVHRGLLVHTTVDVFSVSSNERGVFAGG